MRFAYSAWWTRRSPRLLTPLTRALARSLTHVPLILGTRYRSEPPICVVAWRRSDWKVWIGLLLVISVATAVLGHAPAGSDGTYSV